MQILKSEAASALALAGMLMFAATAARGDDKNIAIVNGVPIPEARLEYVLKVQLEQGKQQDTPELRNQLRDVLITRELLAQEAIRKGLDHTPEVETGVAMAKQEFLIRAYFDDFVKANTISEEEMKAEYERVKALQTGNGERKEYLSRHILVKDEKTAQDLVKQLNKSKGKNFSELAKANSEDSGSKAEGGALGWSDGSNFVGEFSEALVKLKKGEWTKQPVKTQYGYHIIYVEDIREIQFPPFEDVKERIEQQMLAQRRDQAIEALRASAKIE